MVIREAIYWISKLKIAKIKAKLSAETIEGEIYINSIWQTLEIGFPEGFFI